MHFLAVTSIGAFIMGGLYYLLRTPEHKPYRPLTNLQRHEESIKNTRLEYDRREKAGTPPEPRRIVVLRCNDKKCGMLFWRYEENGVINTRCCCGSKASRAYGKVNN